MEYKELIKRLRASNRDALVSSDECAEAIETLLAERNAAVNDLALCKSCATCKFKEKVSLNHPCSSCGIIRPSMGPAKWEWRGPQKECDLWT